MDAGRQLDILIAEKLFKTKVKHLNQRHGWRIDYVAADDQCNDPIMTDWGTDGHVLKKYSTNGKAALEVLEKLKELLNTNRGFSLRFDFRSNVWIAGPYSAGDFGEDEHYAHEQVESADLPHAICLLALKNLEGVST